ncbi:MAG: LLM class flavin-dependent oxidoreductase [Acidimicrobiales bacterium]
MIDAVDPVSLPRLGLHLPGLRGSRAAPGEFEQVAAHALMAERSGFDSLWVTDESAPAGGGKDRWARQLEAYSLLGALAVRTSSADLAVLAAGPMIRSPSVVAKLVTGVDVISHGRGLLAVGLGHRDDRESVVRLEEELAVCRALVVEDAPSYAGRYYQLHRAPNRPRPVRAGGIPLVVVTNRVAAADVIARCADAVIVAGGMTVVEKMVGALDEQCQRAGRSRRDVAVIWSGQAEDRLERTMARLHVLAEIGAEGFILSFSDIDDHDAVATTGEVVSRWVMTLEPVRGPGA